MKIPKPLQQCVDMSRKDRGQEVDSLTHFGCPDYAYGQVRGKFPFIGQKHINESRDACLNMVKAYYEIQDGEKLTGKHRGMFTGMSDQAFTSAADKAGLEAKTCVPGDANAKWSAQELATMLRSGPVICAIQFDPKLLGVRIGVDNGHSIAVTGVDAEGVLYHDPWRGANMKCTLDQFNAMLNDPGGRVWQVTRSATTQATEVSTKAAPAVTGQSSRARQLRQKLDIFRIERNEEQARTREVDRATTELGNNAPPQEVPMNSVDTKTPGLNVTHGADGDHSERVNDLKKQTEELSDETAAAVQGVMEIKVTVETTQTVDIELTPELRASALGYDPRVLLQYMDTQLTDEERKFLEESREKEKR